MHEGQYVEIAQTLERPGLLAKEIALPKAVDVDLDEFVPGPNGTVGILTHVLAVSWIVSGGRGGWRGVLA